MYNCVNVQHITLHNCILLQTAKGQTWQRSQWEDMDLAGGGGGAKAAEIFKLAACLMHLHLMYLVHQCLHVVSKQTSVGSCSAVA